MREKILSYHSIIFYHKILPLCYPNHSDRSSDSVYLSGDLLIQPSRRTRKLPLCQHYLLSESRSASESQKSCGMNILIRISTRALIQLNLVQPIPRNREEEIFSDHSMNFSRLNLLIRHSCGSNRITSSNLILQSQKKVW
jgi:hypothetical protein